VIQCGLCLFGDVLARSTFLAFERVVFPDTYDGAMVLMGTLHRGQFDFARRFSFCFRTRWPRFPVCWSLAACRGEVEERKTSADTVNVRVYVWDIMAKIILKAFGRIASPFDRDGVIIP